MFETKKTRQFRRKYYECTQRIRELEEIICPHESHEFVIKQINFEPMDGYGNEIKRTRLMCEKCNKVQIETEVV